MRLAETARFGQEALYSPVMILSVEPDLIVACSLTEANGHSAGEYINMGKDYFDIQWIDYGEVVSKACQTKAQAMQRLLAIMGIAADEETLMHLCEATSLKQLLGDITEGLGVTELYNLLSNTRTTVSSTAYAAPSQPSFSQASYAAGNVQPEANQMQNNSSQASGAVPQAPQEPQQGTPTPRRFGVRRRSV
ncbi:MAG: hypothetical protein J6C66_02730 [Prevotella sp.]|nr:hypothetical protein [Prevotella sp.]